MNKYRSNNNDVLDFSTCNDIISSFEYKLVDRLYKNNYKLNEDHNIRNYLVNIQIIGKGGQGKVYKITAIDLIDIKNNSKDTYNIKRCGYIVIKIIKDNKSIEYNNELKITNYCKDIIDRRICPNLLYFYGVRYIGNYSIIMSEYADGSLEDWLKTHHSYDEWRSFMFQFLVGVLCVQTKLRGYHSDLKPKNIFYKKLVDTKLTFEYEVVQGKENKQKTFVVPTNGYLYMLGDFGRIQSLLLKHNKLNEHSIKLFIKNNVDLEHIVDLPKRIMVNALEKIYSFDELINIIKLRDDIYFEGYLKNKKDEINKDLYKYPEKIKNKMLYRSIAYYVVEKRYIDPNEVPDNLMVMKLPPSEIINQLENWYGKKNILEILDIFTEYIGETDKTDDFRHITKFKLSF